jgi:repressor LexA
MPNNIRELREAKGLSQRALADAMGVHFTTISKFERSERELTVGWKLKLAAGLGVDPSEIDGGEDVPHLGRKIPIIGQIAAGNWKEAIEAPQGYLPAFGAPEHAFALVVDGESMNKVAPAGAVVTINPDDFTLCDGRYYAILNGDGEATFKQFRADPPRLEPCSTLPEFESFILGREPFTVIGRVIGYAVRYA